MYYYFRQWSRQGAWKNPFLPYCGYQGRKAARKTNALFVSDNQGKMLAIATPQAEQHHDTFALDTLFAERYDLLEAAELRLDGFLLNANK